MAFRLLPVQVFVATIILNRTKILILQKDYKSINAQNKKQALMPV
jgi:hypothetical protein